MLNAIDVPVHMITSLDGRKELVFTSLSTAYFISQQYRNPEPGRNSLLVTKGSKGFFTALHNAAHLYSDQATPAYGYSAETQYCDLMSGSQASVME